jgi:hypothetical protein
MIFVRSISKTCQGISIGICLYKKVSFESHFTNIEFIIDTVQSNNLNYRETPANAKLCHNL